MNFGCFFPVIDIVSDSKQAKRDTILIQTIEGTTSCFFRSTVDTTPYNIIRSDSDDVI